MRLFTGIDLSPEIAAKLEDLLDRLRPAATLNWSRVENLHITTRFIGEWPDDRLAELTAVLRKLPPGGEIPIAVRGLGWFPNPHSPRILYAGVEAPQSLADLARAISDALSAIGVPREERPFRPHLTLARIKEPGKAGPVRRAIGVLESTDFGALTADRFHLYLSRPTTSGSIYTRLEEYRLAG
jgi:2'-5' RNA ligase